MANMVKFIGVVFIASLLFSGCGGRQTYYQQPQIEKVSMAEIEEYEKQYLIEYEKLKSKYADNYIVRWVQPKNKKEACKVYVGTQKNNDHTMDSSYRLYWDGGCKDGFAYGLGREIENGTMKNAEQIGIYEKGMAKNYCTIEDRLTNFQAEGTCSYDHNISDYGVLTNIIDSKGDISITYRAGSMGTPNKPALLKYSSPFQDVIYYQKETPVFVYRISDFTKLPNDEIKYTFELLTKDGKPHGYGFATWKSGGYGALEMANGNELREVLLPQEYFDKANLIKKEIDEAAQKAEYAQQQALLIKKQYKAKICRNSVKVNFMDNRDYKEICNEDKKWAKIQEKIKIKRSELDAIYAKQQEEAEAKAQQQRRQQEYARQQAQANNQRGWDAIINGLNSVTNSMNQANQANQNTLNNYYMNNMNSMIMQNMMNSQRKGWY